MLLIRRSSRDFLDSGQAVNDARLVQVVGGHLHLYPVAGRQPHEFLSHLAGNSCQNLMFIVQFHAKHGPGQDRQYAPFYFNMLFHVKMLSFEKGRGDVLCGRRPCH